MFLNDWHWTKNERCHESCVDENISGFPTYTWRKNKATLFWRNNHVIIASRVGFFFFFCISTETEMVGLIVHTCVTPNLILTVYLDQNVSWWRHRMGTFLRNWPFVRGIHRSPVNSLHKGQWSFDVFFDLRMNKRLSKQSWGWWFEMPSHPLWRHCNVLNTSWPLFQQYQMRELIFICGTTASNTNKDSETEDFTVTVCAPLGLLVEGCQSHLISKTYSKWLIAKEV